jgi:hypothetical protein
MGRLHVSERSDAKRLIACYNAEVAQLVELQPSKLVVASSSLVFRSIKFIQYEANSFISNVD